MQLHAIAINYKNTEKSDFNAQCYCNSITHMYFKRVISIFEKKKVYVKCLFDLNVVVNIPPKMDRVCLFLLSKENGPSLFVFVIQRKWSEFESGPRLMYIENGPSS